MKVFPSLGELKGLASKERSLLPVVMELTADTISPVSAYLRLKATLAVGSKTGVFLLESADGGERVGRYSYVGIDPFASIVSTQDRLTFTDLETGHNETRATNFAALGEYLSRYRAPELPGLPPLTSGAMGYLAYDAIRYVEKIPIPAERYSSHDVRVMFFKKILVFDRLKHRLYLVHMIDASKGRLSQQYDDAVARLENMRRKLERSVSGEEILNLSFADIHSLDPVLAKAALGEETFCRHVQTLKKHIKNGDIFQAVLSDRFTFPVKADPFQIYRILRMINPAPYLYYLSFGDEVLLGASPEMLIRTSGRHMFTHPIAGTRPRGRDVAQDQAYEKELLDSAKEKAEHLMLVDLGRNDLGRMAKPGSVRVDSFMQVERYSHVMHLVSHVNAELARGRTPWDALGAAFPAGTLTGAPKIRAMQIISQLEASARGPYGGAIICQDFAGDLNTCITIRSLYVKDGMGYAQAGAGIVADSRAPAEYQEVLNKAKVIRTAVSAAHSLMARPVDSGAMAVEEGR
jgi:anthranilate synthase component I